MTIERDTHETPMLFRVHRAPVKHGSEVTAVFPCEPADLHGFNMTCYAHMGQHGACSLGWYQETRPAKPHEYASLLRELEGFGYRVKVYQRRTRKHMEAFNAEVRRLLSMQQAAFRRDYCGPSQKGA